MLDELFMTVLDLTKTGSIAILAVIAVRFLLKKAPKVISYALWAVVLFRLLCPVTLELPISAMPEITPVKDTYAFSDVQVSLSDAGKVAYVAAEHALDGETVLQTIPTDKVDESGKPEYVRFDWSDIGVLFGQYVWLLGVAAMVVYSIVSYAKLRRRMAIKIPLGDGVYLADEISFPFVIGIFRPKIYLPSTISQQEQGYVLAHERHHIRRLDPLWKALAFLALVLHWFNPLVWAAFILAGKDMEMSCDEAVIRRMGIQVRADYAQSLTSLATDKRIFVGTPLAFAEGDPKIRIRNLEKWKEPKRWVVVITVAMSVILAFCLLTDPVQAIAQNPHRIQTGDIRPLPPKNPGSSLIEYDPDRQIYIASENVYMDYYIGITELPFVYVRIYSKEYIDPEDISVAFPVDLPFLVRVSQVPVQRKTEAMFRSKDDYGSTMPYYVYYTYRGGDPEEINTNTAIRKDFWTLKPEDLPEFYEYSICVALYNILELDEPVTLEKMDITLGDKTYEAKLGRVRILPKEAFPSDAQTVSMGSGMYTNIVKLYNDGIVRVFAFSEENVPEDITITGLWMLDEESEILDITVRLSSVDGGLEKEWDGKTPIHVKKGDTINIDATIRNELTAKLLNLVHLQPVIELIRDATGEKMCCVTTQLSTLERNAYEHYAIIFDGVDMEPYYREFYQYYFGWVEEYRNQ